LSGKYDRHRTTQKMAGPEFEHAIPAFYRATSSVTSERVK